MVRRTLNEVGRHEAAAPGLRSLDEMFHFRLAIQSRVLEQSRISGEATLFTIADDMEQRFGIRYFVIDRFLLNSSAA
jgi:hypothetical protein